MTLRGRLPPWVALSIVLLPGVAGAAPAVAVVEFTGAKPKAVRERVVAALEKAGIQVRADGIKSPGEDDRAFAKAAGKHKASAIVTGHVELSKSRWRLTLVVRDATGAVQAEKQIAAPWLPGLLKAIDKKAAGEIDEALEAPGSAVPAVELEEEGEDEAPTPGDEAPVEEKEEAAATRDSEPDAESEPAAGDPERDEGGSKGRASGDENQSALVLHVAARVLSRTFDYAGDVNRALLRYGLDGAPAVALGASWYPGAHFTEGAGRHVGVVGTFEQSFAMESQRTATGGPSYSSTSQAFFVGVRGRLPLGAHELGLSAGYGSHRFEIEGDRAVATAQPGLPAAPVERDLLPDVAYSFVRPALDATLRFGKLGVTAAVGYRHVLSLGDLESERWFPRATGSAFDAGLAVSYEIVPRLDVVAGGDLRAYSIETGARSSDASLGRPIAEGAADRYIAGFMGLSWFVPGG